MSRPAQLTTLARTELTTAVRWLARRNPEAARRLRQSVADAARLLGQRPMAGREQIDLVGPHLRLWSVTSFPYVLIYDPRPEPPHILRVAHTARDLGPLLADFAAASEDT